MNTLVKVGVNRSGNGIVVRGVSGSSFKKICKVAKNTRFYKELETLLNINRKKLSKFDKEFKF